MTKRELEDAEERATRKDFRRAKAMAVALAGEFRECGGSARSDGEWWEDMAYDARLLADFAKKVQERCEG